MADLRTRFEHIEKLSREEGLSFFDTYFEIVPMDIMHEIAAYGLPTRASHWSYGKVYNHQKIHGEMGLSRIYEIVLNNDPCYAFLLDSNSDVANILVAAHVFGHCDFFKNNEYFRNSNRNMVNEAVDHAIRIDQYIDRYGLEAVEHVMDIGFALDRHIDVNAGLARKPYPRREVVETEVRPGDYADLFGDERLSVVHTVVGDKLPPHPERDLLWFLANYGRLEPWEKDVLEIIRKESFYFYPQFETKVINEGWASFWHAETMNHYDQLSPSETIDFAHLHSGVVHPGGRFQINPYYLGYKLLVDIEKRWDKMHQAGESRLTGREKLFEVRQTENDLSFISNYLTEDLARDLKLMTYGYVDPDDSDDDVEIKSRDLDQVVKTLIAPKYNYGAPRIVVAEASADRLLLEHPRGDLAPLDLAYAQKTLEYVHDLWKGPVELLTWQGDKTVELTVGPGGFNLTPAAA
ncbi:MAG: SpoVR family protein [Chloroflexota bacterium]